MAEYSKAWVYVDRGLSVYCFIVFILLLKMAATHFRAFKSDGRKRLWKVELLYLGLATLIGILDLFEPVSPLMMAAKFLVGTFYAFKILYLKEEYKPMPATSSAENDFEEAAHFDWPAILDIVRRSGGTFTNYGVRVDLIAETNETVELTYTVLEDTNNFPWHYHRERVIHTVIKGSARFTDYILSEGQTQVKPFGQVHNFFAKKGTIVKVVLHKI